MDKVFISNQIRYDILTMCGKPALQAYNLLADTPLHSIGFEEDEEMCRELEHKLQCIAEEYQTGKQILNGAISKYSTVRQCILLVTV